MRYLVCTVDVDPCPAGSVASISIADAISFSDIGLTPEAVFYVYGWGFAAVFGMWLIGYGVSLAITAIKKL